MANTIDGIVRDIQAGIAAGFRGQLLARGQARAMIWRDGELPEGAPPFSPLLSYDLLSYGYSLLNMSVRLLELGGDPSTARSGFEHAASAIESAVVRGDVSESSWAFHNVLAAAAYHLARFSARAYSLLHPILDGANVSDVERSLALLVTRDIDGLNDLIVRWKKSGSGSDESISSMLESWDAAPDGAPPVNEDGVPHIYEAIELAIVDNFHSGIATFLLALERGDNDLIAAATSLLRSGLESSAEFNFVPLWWTHRLAIHLIGDLWAASFHVRLPSAPSGQEGETEWWRLRQLFISLLYRRKKSEIELWPSQLDAASRAVNLQDDLVVSLPTSAGKTRIAELAILRCLAAGKRVVFVTPLRALSAQTEVGLQRTFLSLGKSISTLYGSIGTSDFEDDAMRKKDIVVATPEKLDFALRSDASLLDDVGLVVLDEGHMIGLGEREVRYEVQIQRLLRRADAASRRIVCLSAILPDGELLEDFVKWLTSDKPGGAIKSDWRPTRLRFGEIVWNGAAAQLNLQVGDERPFVPKFLEAKLPPVGQRRKLFPCDQRELCLATAWRLISDGQSVLIFCTLKASVEPFADAIVDLNQRGALPSILDCSEQKLATALQIGREWLGENSNILKCLRLGVAIHHGSLPTPFRKEVERLLRDGVLKVTVSSPTLAQGLNLSASALIFHSLTRNREVIEHSEFKNVIGRAGRAYVDVEGLILCPMFDDHAKRQANWKTLTSKDASRSMESGLVRLVITLLLRMRAKLGGDTNLLMNYVMNNAAVWDFPIISQEKAEFAQIEQNRWNNFLTSLDTAVLSLVGEDDFPVGDIAEKLDEVLTSSLWERSLARRTEPTQKLIKATLEMRAKHIWTHSTGIGRRSYFLAGVGLDTGLRLDAVSQVVSILLIRANGAVLVGDNDAAIDAFTSIAEILFAIPPFVPDNLPGNWRNVLKAWLLGSPIAEFAQGNEEQVLRFVENGLIYRLAWGMEAVRVRGLAVSDDLGDGLTLSDYELGCAVPAVETGTLSRSAAVLMQAGFNSRLAAISAVEQTKATFLNSRELYAWLRSQEIEKVSATDKWPTTETAEMWKAFRGTFSVEKTKVWKHQAFTVKVDLTKPFEITPGQPFRVGGEDGTELLSATYGPAGTLCSAVNPGRAGLLVAVAQDAPNIRLDYYGPEDLFAA